MSRESVNVEKARMLYDRHRSWAKVAQFLRREDDTQFQPQSIAAAVSAADKAIEIHSARVMLAEARNRRASTSMHTTLLTWAGNARRRASSLSSTEAAE
jgi:hypothetical protein